MLVVASGSGEPALTVANPMRFLHLKIDHFLFLICMYVREPERHQGCCERQAYSGDWRRVDALSRTTATWSV